MGFWFPFYKAHKYKSKHTVHTCKTQKKEQIYFVSVRHLHKASKHTLQQSTCDYVVFCVLVSV